MEANQKYACPCCGFYTLDEEPKGTFDICPVCYWEDDNIQSDDPAYEGGANGVSLIKARENFKKFGAISEQYIQYVRNPAEEETDRFGNEWYAKTLEDGSQIWTQVRKGQITNGGLNPNPRIYNSQSGLSNLMKPETGD